MKTTNNQDANLLNAVEDFDLLDALGLSHTDDKQRFKVYRNIVVAMLTKGFTDENYHQDFLRWLQSELTDWGVPL